MSKLMELYSKYLGPASDTLLDLGAVRYRWKNLYASGSGRFSSAVETTMLTINSGFATALQTKQLLFSSIPTPPTTFYVANWVDSVQQAFMGRPNNIKQSYDGTIYTATSIGVVSNTATERSVVGSGNGTFLLPSDFFVVGKTIRMTASGYFSTQAIPTTLNMRIRLGGSDGLGGTIILQTGDQTPTGSLSNQFWRIVCDLTCTTFDDDTTGTIHGQTVFDHMETVGLTGNPTYWEMTTLSAIGIDVTTENRVQLTADWGAGVAATDSMVCTNFILQTLN